MYLHSVNQQTDLPQTKIFRNIQQPFAQQRINANPNLL